MDFVNNVLELCFDADRMARSRGKGFHHAFHAVVKADRKILRLSFYLVQLSHNIFQRHLDVKVACGEVVAANCAYELLI